MTGEILLKISKQSIENICQFASKEAFLYMKKRAGFSRIFGIATLFTAILQITFESVLKGESKIIPLISPGYISAYIMQHWAPILLPHKIIFWFSIFKISITISLISQISLTPQVRYDESEWPHPKKSNAAKLIWYLVIRLTNGIASSLVPPFPCKYRTVCFALLFGLVKRKPLIFLLFLLIIVISFLRMSWLSIVCYLGPQF